MAPAPRPLHPPETRRGYARTVRHWWVVTVRGALTLLWPGITVLTLTLLIGLWAGIIGVMRIISAVAMRDRLHGVWMSVVSGALSVLFGLLVVVWPGSGALTIAWIIGVYAIIGGLALIALSRRLKVRDHAWRVPGSGR
jgi:uncharacterized membrane protein HdeD (DUF308 family)